MARAQRIMDGLVEAEKAGQGAVTVDGRMVDMASIRMARNVVKTDQAIRFKSG